MKNLMILVKMQLKEQLNFKRLSVDNVKVFHVIASVVGAILKFALVAVLCGAFLFLAKELTLFSMLKDVPTTVISLVFLIMLAVSVVSCVVGLTKSMYYARDNAVLLTLPCRPVQVYLSKLIIFFIFEVKRNLSFLVPLFIAYFFTHNYGVGAYFWMLFCMIIVSLFTVSIGALLSIPAMWVANFFRQRRWLQMAGLASVVVLAVVALFWGISLIPEDIDIPAHWLSIKNSIYDFLASYEKSCAALYDTTLLILGHRQALSVAVYPFLPTFLRFIALLGVTAVLLGAGLLIVQPLFYKMASTPFEYLKKQTKPKANKLRPKTWSAVYNEFLIAIKSSDRMFSNVGILVSIPILIFLLNKIFLAMNTREMGDHMVIAFNVLIILLVALNANCYAASIYSKDGRSSYLMKTQPCKYHLLILSKLVPNTVFVLVSFLITGTILFTTLNISTGNILLLLLGLTMTYLAHMLYSAELDLMNPQTELYATVGSSESNPNEMKATLTAFLFSFAIALIFFLLLTEGSAFTVYVKFALASAAALAYRIWLFFTKIRLYYKEK